jgi:hypothetical protein
VKKILVGACENNEVHRIAGNCWGAVEPRDCLRLGCRKCLSIVTSSPGPRGRLLVTEQDGLTRLCPPTRDYGWRTKTLPEGLGVAASMTLTGSSASSKRDCAR